MLAFAPASISCFEARHQSPARLSLGFTGSQELGVLVLHSSLNMLWLHDPCPYHANPPMCYLQLLTTILSHPAVFEGKLILELWKRQKFCFAEDLESSKSGFCSSWNEMWHFQILGRRKVSKKAAFQIDQNGSFWVGLAWFHNLPEKAWNKSHFKMKNRKGQNKSPLPKNSRQIGRVH